MDHWGNHESGMPPERFKANTKARPKHSHQYEQRPVTAAQSKTRRGAP
jgi:hypothetical protein